MKKLATFFSGKKTYIVGILMLVLGILTGDNQLILEGIAVVTLRQGIAKIK